MTTYHSNDFTNTESFKNLACMGFKVRYHCLPCIPRETVGLATWQASWQVCSNLKRQLNLTKTINKHNSKVKTHDNSVSHWSKEWGTSYCLDANNNQHIRQLQCLNAKPTTFISHASMHTAISFYRFFSSVAL